MTQDIKREISHFEENDWYKIESSEELDPESITHYLKDLIHKTSLNKKSKVLEIASGGGQFGIKLVKETNAEYIGLDLTPSFVKEANKRAKEGKVEANFIQGDAAKLPFKDNSFDIVYVTYSLHHFPNAESLDKVSKEVFRVLKKGGYYYTLEPNGLNPIILSWFLIRSPERVLPLGIKWRENRRLSINETIIYPWQVERSLKTVFPKITSYTLGFIPKTSYFKKRKIFWNRVNKLVKRTPVLNKLGGSFIVIGKK